MSLLLGQATTEGEEGKARQMLSPPVLSTIISQGNTEDSSLWTAVSGAPS